MPPVVARYLSLPEARVAQSALRAYGLRPEAPKDAFASSYWSMLFALGGVRLIVPVDEAEEAANLLADLISSAPEPLSSEDLIKTTPPLGPGHCILTALAQLGGHHFGVAAGLAAAAYRARPTRLRWIVAAVALASSPTVTLPLLLLTDLALRRF